MCDNGNEIAEDTQGRAEHKILRQNFYTNQDISEIRTWRYSQQSLSSDLWFWIFMTNTNDIHGKEEIFGLSEWLGDQISFPFCTKQLKNQPHGNGKQFLTWNIVLTSRYSMAAFDRQLIQTSQQQNTLLIKLRSISCLSQNKYQIICTK